ncbi:hypothetical protein [Lactococcus petauri]|uniref:hypothetical protein n=1 Tax=Lactococcus petauri TaxID=1940789 RepID=UPI001F55B7E7|nr:hypothetical protein [Lactococcus petauri]
MHTITKQNEDLEFSLSQIIRKNLIIRTLSAIIGEKVSELENDKDLVIYTGHFQEIQTLLDCILDESDSNDSDLSKIQIYFDQLTANRKVV